MGIEIERKFLVRGEAWCPVAAGLLYRQGYLSTDPGRTVRVRLAGEAAWLTIKGPPEGLLRPEFEYPIPVADANEMLDRLCRRPLIEKIRHRVSHGGRTWEVDEFLGDNAGLLLAEVELDRPDEEVELPPWAGEEVTEDPRYANAALVDRPFSRW